MGFIADFIRRFPEWVVMTMYYVVGFIVISFIAVQLSGGKDKWGSWFFFCFKTVLGSAIAAGIFLLVQKAGDAMGIGHDIGPYGNYALIFLGAFSGLFVSAIFGGGSAEVS